MHYTKMSISIATLACLALVNCGDKSAPTAKPHIIATTTHIQTILSAVGGNHVRTTALVQGGMCPGHFDIAPQHVAALETADMLIMHGWEQWATQVVEAAGNKDLDVVKLATSGNAMVPEIHRSLAEEITAILCEMDSVNCKDYKQQLDNYLQNIADSARAARNLASPLAGMPVACSEHQKPLLTWLGCSVIVAYGRPESMTPRQRAEIGKAAKMASVRIVVDNVQSGPEAGRALAHDIGAAHIALSNFPLNGSYAQTLLNNVRELIDAVQHEK